MALTERSRQKMDSEELQSVFKSIDPNLKPEKRVVTPFERLEKKIKKQFQKKILIGDIQINDKEWKF